MFEINAYMFSFECQVLTDRQLIADSLDERVRKDVIIIHFSKAFDAVPYYRFLTKIAEPGADLTVVLWVEEFLLGRSQRVRVDWQLSEEVRVTSGVTKRSVLGPLMS